MHVHFRFASGARREKAGSSASQAAISGDVSGKREVGSSEVLSDVPSVGQSLTCVPLEGERAKGYKVFPLRPTSEEMVFASMFFVVKSGVCVQLGPG